MKERAVLYARVSTRKQLDNTSIDGQIEAMEEYARQKGYRVVERIKVAHSGAYGDLPGVQRLLEIGRNDEAEVAIVFRVDRFMRGDDADTDPGIDAAIAERQLNEVGLEVEYLDLPDKDSEAYVWVKTIKRVVASVERRNIKERMIRGRRRKAKEGNAVTHGKEPYGYHLTESDGKQILVIHEPEAQIVRLIYDWYVNGHFSINGIANKLTEMDIPTWADTRGTINKKRGRGVWARSTVSRVLNHEIYTGTLYYGRNVRPEDEWIPVDVPAIIDQATFDAAQKRRQRNKRESSRNRKYNYLLSGRLRCGECGSPMYGTSKNNSYKRYLYYRCVATSGEGLAGVECNAKYWRVDQVDKVVWEWIKAFLTNPSTLVQGLKLEQARRRKANKPLQDRLVIVNELLADNRQQMERLLDLYLVGDFDEEMLTERKSRLEQTLEALEREQEALVKRTETQTLTEQQVQSITKFVRRVSEGLDVARQDFEARQRVVGLLNVEATLAEEDSEQMIYARCILGRDVLPAMPTDLGN